MTAIGTGHSPHAPRGHYHPKEGLPLRLHLPSCLAHRPRRLPYHHRHRFRRKKRFLATQHVPNEADSKKHSNWSAADCGRRFQLALTCSCIHTRGRSRSIVAIQDCCRCHCSGENGQKGTVLCHNFISSQLSHQNLSLSLY